MHICDNVIVYGIIEVRLLYAAVEVLFANCPYLAVEGKGELPTLSTLFENKISVVV